MQIVPFITHYQLVYASFDFSSFSWISCSVGCTKFGCVLLEVARRSNRDGISTVAGRCVAKKRCRRDTVEKQFQLEEHRWYFGVY